MPIGSWIDSPLAATIGWTLLHSLWQGAVLAGTYGLVLFATRSPRIRYCAGCAVGWILRCVRVDVPVYVSPDGRGRYPRAGALPCCKRSRFATVDRTMGIRSGSNRSVPWTVLDCWSEPVLFASCGGFRSCSAPATSRSLRGRTRVASHAGTPRQRDLSLPPGTAPRVGDRRCASRDRSLPAHCSYSRWNLCESRSGGNGSHPAARTAAHPPL